jgi:hypothetical protein
LTMSWCKVWPEPRGLARESVMHSTMPWQVCIQISAACCKGKARRLRPAVGDSDGTLAMALLRGVDDLNVVAESWARIEAEVIHALLVRAHTLEHTHTLMHFTARFVTLDTVHASHVHDEPCVWPAPPAVIESDMQLSDGWACCGSLAQRCAFHVSLLSSGQPTPSLRYRRCVVCPTDGTDKTSCSPSIPASLDGTHMHMHRLHSARCTDGSQHSRMQRFCFWATASCGRRAAAAVDVTSCCMHSPPTAMQPLGHFSDTRFLCTLTACHTHAGRGCKRGHTSCDTHTRLSASISSHNAPSVPRDRVFCRGCGR